MNQKEDSNIIHVMKNLNDYEDMTTSSQKKVYHQYPPYQCKCDFCQSNDIILKDEPVLDISIYSDMDKFEVQQNIQMRSVYNDPAIQQQGEFSVLVQFLIPKAPYKRPPRIYIQDTLFFKNREPYLLIYNQSDDTNLTFITQNTKLQKQFIAQFFYKRRQDFEVKLKIDERQQQGQTLSVMDKTFIQIIRKIKQQISFTLPEHQYAHIFFNQGDASQIISYPEFQLRIEKRKTDDFWGKIQFIQSCSIDKIKILSVRFIYEKESETDLFKLAKDDTNNQFNMPNYWQSKIYQKEKQFLQELIKDRSLYLKYQMFKLCIYAELVNSVRIMRCNMQFIMSPQGNFYLINCRQLFYENVQGIRHSKFFQHYTKNYDKEYQDDLIKQYEKLLINLKEDEIKKQKKFKKYQNSLLKKENESEKQKIFKQIIQEDCDYLNDKYIQQLSKQYDKFDMVEQKALSRKTFHIINQGTEDKDFCDLISIGNDNKVESDNLRLLEKQILFQNFPLKKDQYVKNIEYQIFKEQIEEKKIQHRKLAKNKLYFNDEIQRPQTSIAIRKEQLSDQFVNLQHNFGGKLNPQKIPNSVEDIKKYKEKSSEIQKQEQFIKYQKKNDIKQLYVKKDEILSEIQNQQTHQYKIYQQYFLSRQKQQIEQQNSYQSLQQNQQIQKQWSSEEQIPETYIQQQEQDQIQQIESKQQIEEYNQQEQIQQQINEYPMQQFYKQQQKQKSYSEHKYKNSSGDLKIHIALLKQQFSNTSFVYLQDKISMKQFYDKSNKQIQRIKMSAQRRDYSMGVVHKRINSTKNIAMDNLQLFEMYQNINSDRKNQFAKKIEQFTSMKIQNQFGE